MKIIKRAWKETASDRDRAGVLSKETGLPIPVLNVLISRGIDQPDVIERFLNPRLSDLSDPFLLPDMQKAADRVWQAIDGGQQIVVHGDFDADGVTSTALVVKVLAKLGGKVASFLPNRIDEGYGMSQKGLERCFSLNTPDLLITVDCGTSAQAALAYAKSKNVDVVVTDHHEAAGPTSPAVAVVNPKLGGDDRTLVLAGVGVAFKLCHAVVKDGLSKGRKAVAGVDLRDYLDLVAAGTVADVVPLTGENRILVRHGLVRMQESKCAGLKALIEVGGIKTAIESYHLGFVIGPRLNAAGRMGSAEPALELLLTNDPRRATEIAASLDVLNKERKRTEESVSNGARAEIDGYFDEDRTFGIVSGGRGWHVGIIGIVAAGICGRYSRPAVVVGFDENGMGRGSCRSVESLDIVEVLRGCSDLLISFGGHKMAAGLSIDAGRFEEFKTRFNALCRDRLEKTDLGAVLHVDAWLDLREADMKLFDVIRQMKPFGLGNSAPVWGARNASVVGKPRIVGGSHLKMLIASGATQIDSIAFDMGDREIPEMAVDILFALQENTYLGRTSLQLNIKDIRASEIDGSENLPA